MSFADRLKLSHILRVELHITFESGWRIGSGREGDTGSDSGVLLDADGQPILPGTSLKGRLRSTCERLAHALDLTACALDHDASQVECVSDVKYFRQVNKEYQRQHTFTGRMRWIDEHTCDVCKLFGSPLAASKLQVSDGRIVTQAAQVQVRDSVVLDRDSHTAVPKLKFDYDVVSAGTEFDVTLIGENLKPPQRALLGATLFEWSEGVSLGGFTSRGLGKASVHVNALRMADLSDPKQRVRFLTKRDPRERLEQSDWETYFGTAIENHFLAMEQTSTTTE